MKGKPLGRILFSFEFSITYILDLFFIFLFFYLSFQFVWVPNANTPKSLSYEVEA